MKVQVSEWVLASDCCLKPSAQYFSYIMDENKFYFYEMMMRSALYKTKLLVGFLYKQNVLAHWNNSLWVDISPLSDTLSWFRANQSFLLLLNATWGKQQIPMS